MEQRYKDALQQIYRDKFKLKSDKLSYAEELYPLRRHYLLNSSIQADKSSKVDPKFIEKVDNISEKKLVLDSFTQFADEALIQNENKPVIIEGGEIHKKENDEDSDSQNTYELEPFTFERLKSEWSNLTGEQITLKRHKILPSTKSIDVLFVSDAFVPFDLEKDSLDNEFSTLFEGSTANLFSKMVKAMHLKEDNYLLTAVKSNTDKEIDCFNLVLQEIYLFKPKFIISLGVTASHSLLQSNKRLQEIHGKFFQIQVNDFKSELMPLFSPNLLNTAPNMKKIAWEDMQKVMTKLNL